VLTERAGFAYKSNVVPAAIAVLTGVVGPSKKQDAIIDRAIAGLARRMSCTVEKRWQAEGRTGAAMRYIDLVLKGRGQIAGVDLLSTTHPLGSVTSTVWTAIARPSTFAVTMYVIPSGLPIISPGLRSRGSWSVMLLLSGRDSRRSRPGRSAPWPRR
jgi:hypothetical protein